jgi:hypothetical protein
MGYDIHITRRKNWADEGPPDITIDEWRAIVDADPELIPQPPTPLSPLPAMMLGPTHASSQGARYFCYLSGQIFVSKPNSDVLKKMIAIARLLNARVIGESDEVYSGDGLPDKPTDHVVDDRW